MCHHLNEKTKLKRQEIYLNFVKQTLNSVQLANYIGPC